MRYTCRRSLRPGEAHRAGLQPCAQVARGTTAGARSHRERHDRSREQAGAVCVLPQAVRSGDVNLNT